MPIAVLAATVGWLVASAADARRSPSSEPEPEAGAAEGEREDRVRSTR
jgi:hypothetical protein